ncbi:MAG: hypothetical protein HY077_02105 [Elusimicrobia bacterium]|nr:hypothetical protein [Elusimicrobiota bacterium]
MPADRFDFIEGSSGPLPEDLKRSLAGLRRFGNIELPGEAAPRPVRAEHPCPGCGSPNDHAAVECKSCRRVFEPEPQVVPQGADLAIVLDGQTYKSTDKDLPDDIAALIKRIREKGFTPKLVAEWRSWRATRRSRKARAPEPSRPVPVLRVNGRLLRWSDAALPDELRVLFSFIATNGVTPALLSHLKELGHDVSYDPKAEGGLGLFELRTASSGFELGWLQKRALRFAIAAGLVALVLLPLRNVLPETLQPMLYLLPLGFGLSMALR